MKRNSFLTFVALFITASTALARNYNITQGSITFSKVGDDLHVTQGVIEDTYVFNNGTFSNILIYGNSTVTDNIIVINTPWSSSGYETIITLSNVVIHSETSIPMELTFGTPLKMFLAAGTSNELKTTGVWCPGIKVSDEDGPASITIKGNGKLVVEGGESSAGIGGYLFGNGSNIKIEDRTTVITHGGMGGAGIGGGEATDGGTITISSNATVIAHGGDGGSSGAIIIGGAAGIGGGGSSSEKNYVGGAGGTITISGNARVTAQGGEFAAGIGGGEEGSGGTISIGPSTKVVALSDGTRAAIDDSDNTVAGSGYVMLLNYFSPKTAGTTNTVCSKNWSVLTNIVAGIDYQSIAISLAQTNTYRVRCNSIIQAHQGSVSFIVPTTGMTTFSAVADTNALLYTLSTPVPVPYSWLGEQYPGEPETNYEALANSSGANGVYVWESYVAGLVPTNSTSTFTASITFTNSTRYISWSPNYPDRVYTVQGKAQLSDSTWGATNNASRFFKVSVTIP